MRSGLARATLALGAGALLACGHAEDVVHRGNEDDLIPWTYRCQPAGSGVACTVGDTHLDYTPLVAWTVTGPAVIIAPGQVQATGYGEVAISFTFQGGFSPPTTEAGRYLVDPPRAARRLYWLAGVVREAGTGVYVSDARVTILDGYSAGRQDVTSAFGGFRFETMLIGEEFTVRAERQGYETLVRTYRIDGPEPTSPTSNGPFLALALRRIPGA